MRRVDLSSPVITAGILLPAVSFLLQIWASKTENRLVVLEFVRPRSKSRANPERHRLNELFFQTVTTNLMKARFES